jgi:AAA domain
VLIEIDTVVATAGYKKSGDEDDAVLGAQMIEAMKQISRETGAFVLGVDHFGKAAETGTRGTSAKESGVDVVLATLGERSISGVVTNPRLAVRKVRGGVVGREYAFTTATAPTSTVDSKGRPVSTLKIVWSAEPATVGADTKAKKDAWSKSIKVREIEDVQYLWLARTEVPE